MHEYGLEANFSPTFGRKRHQEMPSEKCGEVTQRETGSCESSDRAPPGALYIVMRHELLVLYYMGTRTLIQMN